MNIIETKNLTKKYKTRTAVDSLNLSVRENETFALLGQNGAGKTTTIKMLSGLVRPTSGEAVIMGKDAVKEESEIKKFMNAAPQETAVASNLTVFENLVFMAEIYGFSKKDAFKKADEMMSRFKLADRANDKSKTLSGGFQRRLNIAMALVSEPKIFFLDEPTLGLDVRARNDLWKVLEELHGKMTVILTTHYLEEAERLSDRAGIIHNGKLKAIGTIDELKHQTGEDSFENVFLKLTEEESK